MTRFTLRDVFWMTLVVGMGAGWWVERRDIKIGEQIWLHECQRMVEVSKGLATENAALRKQLAPNPTEQEPAADGGLNVQD